MKISPYFALFVLNLSVAQAALTYSEDFSSGSGLFTTQNSTNTRNPTTGGLEFGHTNVLPTDSGQDGQGAGIAVDPGLALSNPPINTTLSDILLDNMCVYRICKRRRFICIQQCQRKHG